MESNFNKIKNLMQEDNNQPLPPELGWNNMKDGIFDKVQTIENETASDELKKSSRKRRIIIFFIILFALSLGMFFNSQKMIKNQDNGSFITIQSAKTKTDTSTPDNTKSTSSINQIDSINQGILENDLNANNTDLPKTSDRSNLRQESVLSKNNHINTTQKTETKVLKRNNRSILKNDLNANNTDLLVTTELSKFGQESELSKNNHTNTTQKAETRVLDSNNHLVNTSPSNGTNTSLTPQQKNVAALPLKSNQTNLLDGSISEELNASSQRKHDDGLTSSHSDGINLIHQIPPYLAIVALPSIRFIQISTENQNLPTIKFQHTDSLFNPKIKHNKPWSQLILEGGLTFWDEGDNNTIPSRAQYEAPITSYQLQGYYVRSFKGNYFVMAGLQYQQLESKLVYNTTIDDYKIILKDTIIQVQNNALTGVKRVIYGDAEQSVQAERRVRHYNKTKLFKVSMALGKSWKFSSFQTDLYLGSALNTIVHNQGRMFYNDSIIDYNGSSNILFNNQMTIDGILGARLHYFVTKKIGLTTSFQTQKSLMNWSNQENINFYPTTFSFQLGLSYSLD